MKIALYSPPAFRDMIIPLVNELCKEHEVFLTIENHGEEKVSVWGTENFYMGSLFSNVQSDVNNFMGKDLLRILDKRVKVAILNYRSIKIANPLRYLSTYLLLKYFRKVNPDVIDFHGLHGIFVMPFLAHFTKVLTLHDPIPHSGEFGGYGDKIHRRLGMAYADCIIVHDKKSAECISQKYRHLGNKITTVYLGVNLIYRYWLSSETKEEDTTILFFGRISPYKGIEYLIKAEPLVTRLIPNLKIIIAGRGDFSKYQTMIAHQNRFEIYNQYIPNKFTAELFQRASCVVLPYIDATQSAVLMTAYAFNKPVIVTDVGGLSEVVDDCKTGLVIPSQDETALALAIAKLLNDKELRQKMKSNIKKKIQTEFSWTHIARQIIEAYENAIRN